MKYSLLFSVRNNVEFIDPIILKDGDVEFHHHFEEKRLKTIRIVQNKVDVAFAPQVKPPSKGSPAQITFPASPYKLALIERVRAWQSVLLPFVFVDLDFESIEEKFDADPGEEVGLYSFKSSKMEQKFSNFEFGISARAFLGSNEALNLIDPVAFIIEAKRFREQGAFAQAYSSFYLYFETLLGKGKFKEREVVSNFLSHPDWHVAINEAIEMARSDRRVPFGLPNLNDKQQVTTEMVKLRGRLRHHSMDNQARWSPTEQQAYDVEKFFLEAAASRHLSAFSSQLIWRNDIAERYLKMAHAAGNKAEIHVDVTILLEGRAQRREINLSFPQKTITVDMTTEALVRCIETVREREPVAKLIAMRAIDRSNGIELFRYDVSGAVTA